MAPFILLAIVALIVFGIWKDRQKATRETVEFIDDLRNLPELVENIGCEVDSASLVFFSQHPRLTAKARWLVMMAAGSSMGKREYREESETFWFYVRDKSFYAKYPFAHAYFQYVVYVASPYVGISYEVKGLCGHPKEARYIPK
jgi:hypothetical protein